jgi:hypothetical protein
VCLALKRRISQSETGARRLRPIAVEWSCNGRVITSVTFTCKPADISDHGRDVYVMKACLTDTTSEASPVVFVLSDDNIAAAVLTLLSSN